MINIKRVVMKKANVNLPHKYKAVLEILINKTEGDSVKKDIEEHIESCSNCRHYSLILKELGGFYSQIVSMLRLCLILRRKNI